MLSEESPAQKNMYEMIPFAWNFKTGKLIKKKKQIHCYSRGVWMIEKLQKRTFWSDGNALYLEML